MSRGFHETDIELSYIRLSQVILTSLQPSTRLNLVLGIIHVVAIWPVSLWGESIFSWNLEPIHVMFGLISCSQGVLVIKQVVLGLDISVSG